MVLTRKILLSLYSLQFALVESAKFKNYCSPKVCNKCRSYLVRNYGDRSDRLWLMCSALARNEECCSFVSGPTLFTEVSQVNLEAACSNQPQNYTILSGKRKIEIENCDLEETDEDLKSFLQDEAGLVYLTHNQINVQLFKMNFKVVLLFIMLNDKKISKQVCHMHWEQYSLEFSLL